MPVRIRVSVCLMVLMVSVLAERDALAQPLPPPPVEGVLTLPPLVPPLDATGTPPPPKEMLRASPLPLPKTVPRPSRIIDCGVSVRKNAELGVDFKKQTHEALLAPVAHGCNLAVSSKAPWLKATLKGSGIVGITVLENPDVLVRQSDVVIATGVSSVRITVTQGPALPLLPVQKESKESINESH